MPAVNIDTKGIGEAVGALGGLAKDIRAAITGKAILDPTKQAEIELKFAEIESAAMAAQAAINQAEAVKGGFAGNWRPFIGWTCGVAIGYEFIIAPLTTAITRVWLPLFAMPRLDIDQILTLTLTLLGMAGLRSFEKTKGVAR
jgi:hypothetical protein